MAPHAIVLTPKREEPSPSEVYVTLPDAPPLLSPPASTGFKRVHLRPSSDEDENPSAFPSNAVTTSRFTWYSFLPLFLIASFSKIANLYFLLVSVFQMIPSISPTGGVPTQLFPLVAVLLIDAVFAAVEDYRRHADDARANAAPTLIYRHKDQSFQPAQWRDIHVGDVIQICNHETVPADVVVLSVAPSKALGVCYVETKSLDGESNLKLREAPRVTRRLFESEAAIAIAPSGHVDMEQPNSDVHSFSGTLFLQEPKSDGIGMDSVPLSIKNVLLRGSKLRNADSVYGLVVNTGTDCKVLRSSLEASAPTKSSSLEAVTNRQVLVVVVLLAGVCLVGAITDNSSLADLNFLSAFVRPDSADKSLVETFAYYLTILCDLVPITLYVTITVVRALQSFFMTRDLDMYDAASDTPLTVRSMQLNEQLGQISHVFADKTGTLTSNLMELRRASVRGRQYDDLADAEGELAFFTHLALCHSVLIEHSTGHVEDEDIVYSAASPDEQALVCGARDFGGVTFVRREPERVEIRLRSGEVETYAVLEAFDFTSDRKRMSVVVQKQTSDGSEQPVLVLTKGSDSVLFSRLSPDSLAMKHATQSHLKAFAHDGLRTLVIASKGMNQVEWEEFDARYKRARSDLRQVEAQSQGLENDIDTLQDDMERDLELLGATAIEDELQDGVPETIETLRAAGVTVWMLTGDMLETAMNIGQSCHLLHEDMHTHVIRTEAHDHNDHGQSTPSKDDVLRQLNDAYTSICQLKNAAGVSADAGQDHALVIDGASLHLILGELSFASDDKAKEDDADISHLLKVALLCRAVIACRVSPQQKAQLVQLVKQNVPDAHTLAIGDGANDVPMLLAAHVGVGIAGQEGMQAVNNSDYAFAQFRFLQPLLLAHGRWNYNRVAGLIGYTFYKNIVYSLSLFWFCLNTSSYSGAMFYSPLIQQFYNLIFTLLPIALFAIQDRDLLPKALVLQYPALYHRDNRRRAEFTQRSFWTWVTLAVVDSVALFFVILASSVGVMRNAETVELTVLWSLGWTIMVTFVTARFCLLVNSWTVIEISGVVFSLVAMLAVQILFDSLTWTGGEDFNTYSFPWILARPQLWLGMLLAVVVILVKDVAYAAYVRRFRPQFIDLVHELQWDGAEGITSEQTVA